MRDDHVDRRRRLGAVQVFRTLIVVAVAAGAVLTDPGSRSVAVVLAVGALYGIATTAFELSRQLMGSRTRSPSWLLLVDAAFASAAIAVVGGPSGPLLFLPFAHVVAVGLLISGPVSMATAVAHVASLFTVMTISLATGTATDGEAGYTAIAVGVLAVAASTMLVGRLVEREHAQQIDELDALAALADRCTRALSVADIEVALVEVCVAAFGYQGGAVLLGPGRRLESSSGGRRARLVADVVAEEPAMHPRLADARNVVVVPLAVESEWLGTAALVWGAEVIPGRVVAATERFCAHAGLAIHNLQLREAMEALAAMDPLTGLANRRRFDAALDHEVQRARRYGDAFCVAIVDIDHFKVVNDTHGHAVGDAVLRDVGTVLTASVRDVDLPARLGGEEFVILMPSTRLAGALEVADRLRERLACGEGPVRVTVSVGVAEYDGRTGDDVVAAADAALYRAKRAGRNRAYAA